MVHFCQIVNRHGVFIKFADWSKIAKYKHDLSLFFSFADCKY